MTLEKFLKDLIEFLETPDHEIVRTYSDDHQRDTVYRGLALSWEEERNQLLEQAMELLSAGNQV